MTSHFRLNDLEAGFFSGVYVFGAMIGSISGGWLCNKYGRKVVRRRRAWFALADRFVLSSNCVTTAAQAVALVGLLSGIFTIMAGFVPL